MKTLILAALAALMLTLPASAVAAPRCAAMTTVLQERLTELHYPTGGVDGCAGASTKAAVQAFQKANGLTADGVVGAKTRAALKAPATVEPVSTRKARHVEVDLELVANANRANAGQSVGRHAGPTELADPVADGGKHSRK